jgi:hypothetical protein
LDHTVETIRNTVDGMATSPHRQHPEAILGWSSPYQKKTGLRRISSKAAQAY